MSPTYCGVSCPGRRGSGRRSRSATNTVRISGPRDITRSCRDHCALADSGTPFSILTKGTLLRRDLPLITEAAVRVDVSVAVSLAVGDPELHSTSSGHADTPGPHGAHLCRPRAGPDYHVIVAPVLPHLTDSPRISTCCSARSPRREPRA